MQPPLLLLLLLSLLALIALAANGQSSSTSPPPAAPSTRTPLQGGGGGSGSWRQDAATALRLGLDWTSTDADADDDSDDDLDESMDPHSRSQRAGASGVVEVATAHLWESARAAWMPLEWALQRAMSSDDDDQPHPLDRTYEAAVAVLRAATGRTKEQPAPSQPDDLATAAAAARHSRLQLNVADTPPAQFVRFSSLTGWYGTDPIRQLSVPSSVSVQCVGCDRSTAVSPSVQWQLQDGTAQAGVHFDVLGQSPLPFLPSTPSDASGIFFTVRPAISDPFASTESRRNSLLTRNFTARIFNARAGADAGGEGASIPVQTSDSPDTFGEESWTSVRVRPQSLPTLYFLSSNISVSDVDSVAIFSLACEQCGMVDIQAVISADVMGRALDDVWGADPDARRPLSIVLPLGSAVPSLPVGQPDLSLEGWTARGLGNVTVAWLDEASDPNRLQVVHFAVHLAPRRAFQMTREVRFAFQVQAIDSVEDGVPPPAGSSAARFGSDETAMMAVPIVVRNDTATGHFPSALLHIAPTLFCSPHGRMAQANRTLQTCLTPSDDASAAQSIANYTRFIEGPLLDALEGRLPDGAQVDPSLTDQTSCDDVRAWIDASDWYQTSVANQQAFIDANVTVQDAMLYDACANLTTGASAESLQTTLVQYCILYERCYARSHFCHSWPDVLAYCICPYDRTGDNCQTMEPFQCDVRMVYPAMDVQRYEDADGAMLPYSCPLPSSYRARLPTTYANPGSNSNVPLLPSLTNLQRKYNYIPWLDGEPPCIEYPSPAGEAQANPCVTNPHPLTNPNGGQQFRFALHCAFMNDQDPKGENTALPPAEGARPPTYSHVRQSPSDAALQRLAAGGYEWNKDYDSVTPPWAYEVLRRTDEGEVLFASSAVSVGDDKNALRLRLHAQNFIVMSDSSRDVVSDAATAAVLQSPPPSAVVAAVGTSGDPTPLLDSTLGLTLNLTSLPSDSYWRGGRLYLEAWLQTHFERADPPASEWISVPRGLDPLSSRVPARIVIEQQGYKLPPPHNTRKLSMSAIALLVLLGLAVVAAIYKYYEHQREEQFQRLVQRAKARSARAAREANEAREAQQMRHSARQRQLNIQ